MRASDSDIESESESDIESESESDIASESESDIKSESESDIASLCDEWGWGKQCPDWGNRVSATTGGRGGEKEKEGGETERDRDRGRACQRERGERVGERPGAFRSIRGRQPTRPPPAAAAPAM